MRYWFLANSQTCLHLLLKEPSIGHSRKNPILTAGTKAPFQPWQINFTDSFLMAYVFCTHLRFVLSLLLWQKSWPVYIIPTIWSSWYLQINKCQLPLFECPHMNEHYIYIAILFLSSLQEDWREAIQVALDPQ